MKTKDMAEKPAERLGRIVCPTCGSNAIWLERVAVTSWRVSQVVYHEGGVIHVSIDDCPEDWDHMDDPSDMDSFPSGSVTERAGLDRSPRPEATFRDGATSHLACGKGHIWIPPKWVFDALIDQ